MSAQDPISGGISPEFFNDVAQNGHLLAGSTVALTPLAFYQPALWYVIGIFVILTAVKEFWYDQHYEDAATRGSNLNDWVHYQLGWVIPVAIFYSIQPWIVHP